MEGLQLCLCLCEGAASYMSRGSTRAWEKVNNNNYYSKAYRPVPRHLDLGESGMRNGFLTLVVIIHKLAANL